MFWCDAGVADQLQTNYASDLRSILKTLFEVMATKCEQGDNEKQKRGKEQVLEAAISFFSVAQTLFKDITVHIAQNIVKTQYWSEKFTFIVQVNAAIMFTYIIVMDLKGVAISDELAHN